MTCQWYNFGWNKLAKARCLEAMNVLEVMNGLVSRRFTDDGMKKLLSREPVKPPLQRTYLGDAEKGRNVSVVKISNDCVKIAKVPEL